MDSTKKKIDPYVEVEIDGMACKVRKFTPPATEGPIVAPKGFVDKDGKQLAFAERNLPDVLIENPHLIDVFLDYIKAGTIINNAN